VNGHDHTEFFSGSPPKSRKRTITFRDVDRVLECLSGPEYEPIKNKGKAVLDGLGRTIKIAANSSDSMDGDKTIRHLIYMLDSVIGVMIAGGVFQRSSPLESVSRK